VIGQTLESFNGLTDDIVVYDSGSSDGTIEIIREKGARLFRGQWEGFGPTKRKAVSLAKYEWVLSLDADESLSPGLRNEISRLLLQDRNVVYELRFKNFFGNKALKFGEWGGDRHVRLFNRSVVNWNDAVVHESLQLPAGIKKITLKGFVWHYTARNPAAYAAKLEGYAALNAEKYHRQGRRPGWFRTSFAPVFSFLSNYVLKLGFLDGRAGYKCARMTARYTYLKYAKLREMNRG
jgi:glycosyltransferase involved in cell wall biosynthesis